MPHTRAADRRPRRDLRQLLRQQLAVLPVAVTTLRGQYAHNTGVWSNGGSNGGFERAFTRRDRAGHRRHAAAAASGYRTALVGKYLNGYPNGVSPDVPAPGLDHVRRARRSAPRTASTATRSTTTAGSSTTAAATATTGPTCTCAAPSTSCAARCTRTCRSSRTSRCTHRTSRRRRRAATPALFPHARVPRTAAYNQADVRRDAALRARPPAVQPRRARAIDVLYRLRIRSLQAVDRGVAQAGAHAAQRPGSSTTPTSCSRRTTASTSASTGCRRGSRRRTTPTSTCRC